MVRKIKKVVGVAFIKDGKLLIVQSKKSLKTDSWTFVGGGVEEGETIYEAALREVSEEIQGGFTITCNDLQFLFSFEEHAASDSSLIIEMNVFLCNKKINVELIPNDEIVRFYWYGVRDVDKNVSASIAKHFVPYALEKNIMY